MILCKNLGKNEIDHFIEKYNFKISGYKREALNSFITIKVD